MKDADSHARRQFALTGDSLIRASEGQTSVDLDGQVVILGVKTGRYYQLDNVGARIWSMLREPRRLSAIIDTIVQEYDAERVRIEADVTDLIQDLASEQLVEISEAPIRGVK